MGLSATVRTAFATIVGAARSAIRTPTEGRIVRTVREDIDRDYVSIGLTPAKLTTLLKAFDSGDLSCGLHLAEQIEEKDLHVYAVANTRRLAVTGLPWEVVSAADVDKTADRGQADQAAAYCRDRLRRISTFDGALRHLALAVGRNISVAELVWERGELADVVPVPHSRLTFDTQGDAPALRILTAEERTRGVAMEPAKWIVHTPYSLAGAPMYGGLFRATAAAYLAKAFSIKDWLIFIELFGMPVRIARYEPTATPQEKAELLEMLQSLGADAAGVFSKAVELDIVESVKQSAPPYEAAANFFNRELSKAWLGQTLTTEATEVGARSLGVVHDHVRKDLRSADLADEAATIRRDLLAPMTRFQFGNDTPVPYFRRRLEVPRDPVELSDSVRAAVDMGVKVSRTWFAKQLGVVTSEDPARALSRPAPSVPALPFSDVSRDHEAVLVLARRQRTAQRGRKA